MKTTFTTLLCILLCSIVFAQQNITYTQLELAAQNKDSVYNLDLSSQQLTEIPSIISEFRNLERLNLSNNNISKIDENFRFPEKLVQLVLSHNQLLAFNIKPIKSLVSLELNDNKIEKLNNNIGDFKELWLLDLEANQLDELPSSITKLPKLKRLLLGGNNLKALPNGWNKNEFMEVLSCENNHIKALPKNICRITSLNLSYNNMTVLPNVMSKNQVHQLILIGNNIKSFNTTVKNERFNGQIDLRNNGVPKEQSKILQQKLPNAILLFKNNDLQESGINYEVAQ